MVNLSGAASTLTGAESVAILQGGVSKRTTTSAIGALANGTRTLTVGESGANFSRIADALAYRDTQGHTLLGTYTGSITYTPGVDNRFISLTTQIPSSIYKAKGNLGVRIGGTGNPILRCNLTMDDPSTDPWPSTTSKIRLFAPIQATFTGVQIDLYQLIPYGVMILPGNNIELSTATVGVGVIIPAYTTIYCPVMRGASLFHDGVSGNRESFSKRNDQNEIYFRNLVLSDALNEINNFFWHLPEASAANCQTLCEYGIYDCDMETAAQDFLYAGNGTQPLGAIHLHRNRIRGTYDFINPVLSRRFDVVDNLITMHGHGLSEGSNPTGMPIGQNGTEGYTYPNIEYNIRGNVFDIIGTTTQAGENTRPTGVSVRQSLPTQSVIDIASNKFRVIRVGGDAGVSTDKTIGVQANAAGTANPKILVRNNTFDIRDTGGALGGATYTMHSNNAAYVIKRQGNVTINGTLGSNTAAIAVET